MRLSNFIALQLLSTFACVLADDWSVLPSPAPAESKPASVVAEWKILDAPAVVPVLPAVPLDWSILPVSLPTTAKPMEGSPDKDSATDGLIRPSVSPPIPKPVKLACSVDCACGICECGEKCLCCSGYGALHAAALKTKTPAIIYVGDRKEDADAARKEAKARGYLFMSARSLEVVRDGKTVPFGDGTREVKPEGNRLVFVARESRRIPQPDKEPETGPSRFERLAPADCPNCQRAGNRRR